MVWRPVTSTHSLPWHDMIASDRNWEHLVVDVKYGASLWAGLAFGAFGLLSGEGFNKGLVSWLVVSSGHMFFFASVWFALHHIFFAIKTAAALKRAGAAQTAAILTAAGLHLAATYFVYNSFVICLLVALSYSAVYNLVRKVLGIDARYGTLSRCLWSGAWSGAWSDVRLLSLASRLAHVVFPGGSHQIRC